MVLCRFAFEELALHRLQASIIPRNGPSHRVAEKLGLRNEGIALRYLEINGVWEDHVRYAITSEDWAERRDEYLRDWILPREVEPDLAVRLRTTAGECRKNDSTSLS